MAFRYEGCEFCAFHEVEPGICDDCEDESEFEPLDEEDSMLVLKNVSMPELFFSISSDNHKKRKCACAQKELLKEAA